MSMSDSLPQNLRTALDALALIRMLGDADGMKNLAAELDTRTTQAGAAYERLAVQQKASDEAKAALEGRQKELTRATAKLDADRHQFASDRVAFLAQLADDKVAVAADKQALGVKVAQLAADREQIDRDLVHLNAAHNAVAAREGIVKRAAAEITSREAAVVARETALAAAEAEHERRAEKLRSALT